MKVDLVTRADAFTKPGGDVSQLRQTGDALMRRGCDVRTVAFTAGFVPRPGAVVHFFNVDRPFEAIATARKAERAGAVFVISTIHHSRRHVARMRRADGRSITAHLPETLRALAVFVRQLLRDDASWRARAADAARSMVIAWTLTRRTGQLLDGADTVLLLGKAEADALRRDLNWSSDNGVVAPNGVPSIHLTEPADEAETGGQIVVIGRIEQRKRQLELLRCADRLSIGVTFAGGLNPNQTAYGARFATEVEASLFSSWTGEITAEAVHALLADARVLINASWVEVQSLVDIEAARSGCHVVNLEDGGASKEWLGDLVTEVPHDRLDEALHAAVRLAQSSEPRPACSYDQTWEQTAATITSRYARREVTS